MATSSITASFHCSKSKAANTFVDLLLAETPPEKWTAPVPGTVRVSRRSGGKREIRSVVQRVVRARQARARA